METAILITFQLVILIFSVVIHEIAHGYMAERLGDPTARLAGRLTLNPVKHLDFFGSFLFPVLLILFRSPVLLGWAKPVPYNPFQLTKDMRYGSLKVALAGPASNIFLFLVFGLLARFSVGTVNPFAIAFFAMIAYLNISLAVLNLVPIPPLDGSRILTVLLPPRYALALERVSMNGIFLVLIFLFLFSPILSRIISFGFASVAGATVSRLMSAAF